ncbi:MAG: carboxylating nicotinate-nucleotide diphosphorylase [Verrucomicrobiales bacterium]
MAFDAGANRLERLTEPTDLAQESWSTLLDLALREDLGESLLQGDLTCQWFLDASVEIIADFRLRQPGVVSGLGLVAELFVKLDPQIKLKILSEEGAYCEAGQGLAQIHGPARSILAGERVALNFLQRLSAVATATRRYVEAVQGTGAKICDTRKTAPGWRYLEKAAVRAGGGVNHRFGLFDAVMIKDNHLMGTGAELHEKVRHFRTTNPTVPLMIEADTLEQVRQFVSWPELDLVLLDNMPVAMLEQAVALRRPGLLFEASGGVTLDTVRAIAETGVDRISVGALTHSAGSLDIGLDVLS